VTLKVGNTLDTLLAVCLHLVPSTGSTQKQFLALTYRSYNDLSFFFAQFFAIFILIFSTLRQHQKHRNAWHSTANAFQRKVFKQIFAQLAGWLTGQGQDQGG